MKVALLGGSFDPVHNGHLALARAALDQLDIDEVWFVVSRSTPLKDRVLSDAAARLDMVKLAIADEPRMKVTDIELRRPKISYTIDTIRELSELFPENEWIWLLGGDQAAQFSQWKDHDQLVKLAKFAVARRKGMQDPDVDEEDFLYLNMPEINCSSTNIRNGEELNFLPRPVLEKILDEELYLYNWVKRPLNPHRFAHSVSVANLCRQLAIAHGYDPHKAWLAGMFHDIAKDLPKPELEKWVRAVAPEALDEAHAIWHGYAGAAIAKRIYGIEDPAIYNAIFNHVKGTSYDPYAMMLFIADKLDPLRGYDSQGLINACLHDLYNGFMLVKRENKDFVEKELADRQKKQMAEKAGKEESSQE